VAELPARSVLEGEDGGDQAGEAVEVVHRRDPLPEGGVGAQRLEQRAEGGLAALLVGGGGLPDDDQRRHRLRRRRAGAHQQIDQRPEEVVVVEGGPGARHDEEAQAAAGDQGEPGGGLVGGVELEEAPGDQGLDQRRHRLGHGVDHRVGGVLRRHGGRRTGQQGAQPAGDRGAQLALARSRQPQDLAEVSHLGVIVEGEALGGPQHAGGLGAGGHDGGLGRRDEVVVEPLGGEQQHRRLRQVAIDQLPEAVLAQTVLDLLVGVELGPQPAVRALQLLVLGLDVGEVAVQGIDGGPVDEGRTERQPDPQRQEDGRDGHDVVAEVDHGASGLGVSLGGGLR
jgi:hypothetical protein